MKERNSTMMCLQRKGMARFDIFDVGRSVLQPARRFAVQSLLVLKQCHIVCRLTSDQGSKWWGSIYIKKYATAQVPVARGSGW